MAHFIEITNFGPIDYCALDVDGLTVLTGPQASGKSTIAKAVYFFRTIKDEIFDLVVRPMIIGEFIENLRYRLYVKFRNMFGIHQLNGSANLKYFYNKGDTGTFVEVNINNYFSFNTGAAAGREIIQLVNEISAHMNARVKEYDIDALKQKLSQVFRDDYETVYIPSGRSTISLLHKHIPSMFATMEDWQRNDIDYCTRRFIELILKIKPWFSERRTIDVNKFSSIRPIYEVQRLSRETLGATYQCDENNERLHLIGDDKKISVEINYASSGQQEAVWVFNLLTYFQVEEKKLFLVLEEPEAHLHPEAQYMLIKAITTFCNHTTSQGFITTHSPYVLTSFNNLLYAGKISKIQQIQRKLKEIIPEYTWLDPIGFYAYVLDDGKTRSIKDENLAMIDLEALDAVAARQDDEYEQMLALVTEENK